MSATFRIALEGQTVPLRFQTVSFAGIREIVSADITQDINARAAKAANLSDLADGDAALANLDFVQSGASASIRSARAWMRERAPSVKDYGATGDGTTDDTAAFIAAALAHPGDIIYVPAATYKLGQVGRFDDAGTSFRGAGRRATIIKPIATMTAGQAIFSNSQAASGTTAFGFVEDIGFDLLGQNCIAVDLSSCTNFNVNRCHFDGGANYATAAGVGVKFGAPRNEASYTNTVTNCSGNALAKGIQWGTNANSNMVIGGEMLNCLIGADAAPATYLDTPRIIGMRFEGCGVDIKIRALGAHVLATRHEASITADIEFVAGSDRCEVFGAYTASGAGATILNPQNCTNLNCPAGDLGWYESHNGAKYLQGLHIFSGVGSVLVPSFLNNGQAAYFYDDVYIRNQVGLRWTNALNNGTVLSLSVDSSNRTNLRSFDSVLGTDRDTVVGGGAAVIPVSNGFTDIGATGFRYKDGWFSGNIFSSTGVLSLEGAGGLVYINGVIVVRTRRTGWSVDTGTAKRTANATYAAGAALTFGAAYVQAEHTAMATRLAAVEAALQDATQTIKGLKDDLHSTAGHGLIGP